MVKKSERMNIPISPNDLRRLKIKAMEEGMPYQTLVSSITQVLHNVSLEATYEFATGFLVFAQRPTWVLGNQFF